MIAHRSIKLAVIAILGSSISAFAVAHEIVHRYDVTGWSDGLEGFAYVYACVIAVVWTLAAVGFRAARPPKQPDVSPR